MIYLYNSPADSIGMYLDYFKVYFFHDREYLYGLLDRYQYISTKNPAEAK